MIKLIAFDADDTLWHNEILYQETQARFQQLLAAYRPAEEINTALFETEMQNLPIFGYGIKSFALSMIQTAVQVSGEQVKAEEVLQIVDFARDMVRSEVRLIENVRETIAHLANSYELMVITKGDLLDQEAKLERSGLREYFKYFETLTDKTPQRYQMLMERYSIAASSFLMVGNSLRSDILPVLALGGQAVYIPYPLLWEHERAEISESERTYHEISSIADLPELLNRINSENGQGEAGLE